MSETNKPQSKEQVVHLYKKAERITLKKPMANTPIFGFS